MIEFDRNFAFDNSVESTIATGKVLTKCTETAEFAERLDLEGARKVR
jgi:hypothetical protein